MFSGLRTRLIAGALAVSAAGLVLATAPLQAIGTWNLGTSVNLAQQWVERVAPEVVAPVTGLVRSLLSAPRLDQGPVDGTNPVEPPPSTPQQDPWVRTDKWNY